MQDAANLSQLALLPFLALDEPVERVIDLDAVAQKPENVSSVAVVIVVLAAAQQVVVSSVTHLALAFKETRKPGNQETNTSGSTKFYLKGI